MTINPNLYLDKPRGGIVAANSQSFQNGQPAPEPSETTISISRYRDAVDDSWKMDQADQDWRDFIRIKILFQFQIAPQPISIAKSGLNQISSGSKMQTRSC